MANSLESLVERAKEGEKRALEELVLRIQDRIYGLALRMLYYPDDAKDETQEILIKIITHLGRFRGESRFMTWAYSVASNHLLTNRKSRVKRRELTFEISETMIEEGLSYSGNQVYNESEQILMVEEMKLLCMQTLLRCLSPENRITFILGDVFGVTSLEGGQILDITSDSFRKRLSRARKMILDFMAAQCGLFNPDNRCHCEKIFPCYVEKTGTIDPKNMLFADHPCRPKKSNEARENMNEFDELMRMTLLFRSHPDYAAPDAFVDIIRELIKSERFEMLQSDEKS